MFSNNGNPNLLHSQISRFYSSNVEVDGDTMTVRDYLTGTDYGFQDAFGQQVVESMAQDGNVFEESGATELFMVVIAALAL
jgi:hypothetical protein